jgi:hypothetical protein
MSTESLQRLHDEGKLKHIDMLLLNHLEDLYEVDFQLCERLRLFERESFVIADRMAKPECSGYRAFVRAREDLYSIGIRASTPSGKCEEEMEVSQFL